MPMGTPRPLACALLLAALACTPSDAPDGADAPTAAAATPASAPSPQEEAEIVAALQTVFDALESGDGDLLRSVLAPDVLMSWANSRGGETTLGRMGMDDIVADIESSEVPLIERMWDPVVRVDGPLATIWAPYDFYVGADFSHCGIDAATLQKGPDGWRIVSLSWTLQAPPDCPLHPEGPPAP